MNNLKNSIEYVKKYNDWRRGAEIPPPEPKALGAAIECVLIAAEKHQKRISGEEWMPIETAKNSNGSDSFLAYITGHGQCVCFKFCSLVFNASKKNRKEIKSATHWKPLDPPPCNHLPQVGGMVKVKDE